MKVTSFPVVVRHTAVWVWLGKPESADPARIPDLSYIDNVPETARIAGYLPTNANYELMTDNILDLSHADYLHPTSLGGMMSSAATNSRLSGDDVIVEWDARDCVPPGAFQLVVPPACERRYLDTGPLVGAGGHDAGHVRG
jgi:vanillate O-demethylase monooxygenase subunit